MPGLSYNWLSGWNENSPCGCHRYWNFNDEYESEEIELSEVIVLPEILNGHFFYRRELYKLIGAMFAAWVGSFFGSGGTFLGILYGWMLVFAILVGMIFRTIVNSYNRVVCRQFFPYSYQKIDNYCFGN